MCLHSGRAGLLTQPAMMASCAGSPGAVSARLHGRNCVTTPARNACHVAVESCYSSWVSKMGSRCPSVTVCRCVRHTVTVTVTAAMQSMLDMSADVLF